MRMVFLTLVLLTLAIAAMVVLVIGWPAARALLSVCLPIMVIVTVIAIFIAMWRFAVRSAPRRGSETVLLGIVGGVALAVALVQSFARFLTQARYSAEPIPAIGMLLTKIALHHCERDSLPGVRRDGDREPARQEGEEPVALAGKHTDSGLEPGATNGWIAQSFVATASTNATGGISRYVPSYQTGTGEFAACEEGMIERHFTTHLDCDEQDMTGMRLRPDMIQYAALQSPQGGDYLYALGAFGGSTGGYAPGTGYALLEVCHRRLQRKERIVWQRYDRFGKRQTSFRLQPEDTPFDPYDEATAHLCPIPMELFTAKTGADFDAALRTLRSWGWGRELRDPNRVRKVRASQLVATACAVVALLSGVLRFRKHAGHPKDGVKARLAWTLQLIWAGLASLLAAASVMAVVALALLLIVPIR